MNEVIHLENVKRRTELYLRALWNRAFSLSNAESETQESTPFSYIIENHIYLRQQVNVNSRQINYYRAAAVHASLHLIYSSAALENKNFNLMQRTLIGLVEDLRIELMAISQFPGLRKLWLEFHAINNAEADDARMLMLRLSRSVLDPLFHDDHQWVKKGKSLILDSSGISNNTDFSETIGLSLANDLGQMRLPLNSGRYEQLVIYRDDNRCLWNELIEKPSEENTVAEAEKTNFLKNTLQEQDTGTELKFSEREVAGGSEYFIRQAEQASLEYRQLVTEKAETSTLYPEWDYRIHVLKENWCNVVETKAHSGSTEVLDIIYSKHRIILNSLRHMARQLQAKDRQRIRKITEGDELDLDPAIDAMLALRTHSTPDMRVFVRNDYRRVKDTAITILLDLSESTNEMVNGTGNTVSQLIRDAVVLLGETISITGDPFSIYGFSSKGRHDIQFINYKDFEQSFDETKASLAGIHGAYSTRLGAAIRHSQTHLSKQPQRRKALLLITDGAPSDIDVYDTQYLQHDARDATRSLSADGIKPFCLNLDSQSDSVIKQIFGEGRYMTLDGLRGLSDILLSIYIKNIRH
ncbi:MAG: VWA domain-containing protein [Gammaproteobacteria bacterium]|nr:VWA domain-containing protein [Gammaproteobacteria bacterium]